jgi:hypothetical protein
MRREVEEHADDEEPLRPGKAFERRAHRAAHGAARAVGADEIAAADRLDAPGRLDAGEDPVAVLGRIDEAMRKAHRAAEAAEAVVEQRRQLVLLAVQAERVRRHIGEHRQIPFDDDAFVAAADLPARHLDAHGAEVLRDAERLEQLHGRRMKAAGAQIARQHRLGFEHDRGHVAKRETRRDRQPGGAGADDDDGRALGYCTHSSFTFCARCRS